MADDDTLSYAATRAASDPFFLGHLFELMIASGRATRDSLASSLACSQNQLVTLYLCRLPRIEAQYFREDLLRIAGFARCDAAVLAHLVREADALRSMRSPNSQHSSSFLLAARDRITDGTSERPREEPRE